MSMRRGIRVGAVLLIGTLLVAGCDAHSTSGEITVAGVIKEAQPAVGNEQAACPVPYDMAAAAKAADLAGTPSPGPDPVDVTVVTTAAAASPSPNSFLAPIAPAARVFCAYRIGGVAMHTQLLVASKADSAVQTELPAVMAVGKFRDVGPFFKKVRTTQPGTAVVTPGNRAAVARLAVKDGDGCLVVGVTEPAGGISSAKLSRLTESLASQVR